jgi:hypothetical protein
MQLHQGYFQYLHNRQEERPLMHYFDSGKSVVNDARAVGTSEAV